MPPKLGSAFGNDDLASLGPELDFSTDGGAWYSVRLRLREDTLIVSYLDFPDHVDERFNSGSFATADEIAAFRSRFRLTSPQLQDSQCPQVHPGMLVCASSVDPDDSALLFYDAIVDSVKRDRHTSNVEGEECLCTFIISWITGPKVGTLSLAKIDSICLIQPSALEDSRLDSFIRLCEEKLDLCPLSSTAVLQNSACKMDYKLHEEDYDLGGGNTLKASKYRMDANLGADYNFMSVDGIEKDSAASVECKNEYKRRKKSDLGGHILKTSTYQMDANISADYSFFLIDNMEKDLVPSTVVNFIHKHTSIYVKAYIFPSIPSESFTRGAIAVDSAQHLETLHGFLINNSDQIIVSSKGRPWIVAYETHCKSLSAWFTGPNTEITKGNPGSELKMIRSGCQEYNTVLQLRELFLEFKNHLKRLHGRLRLEEITLSSLAGCSVDTRLALNAL